MLFYPSKLLCDRVDRPRLSRHCMLGDFGICMPNDSIALQRRAAWDGALSTGEEQLLRQIEIPMR